MSDTLAIAMTRHVKVPKVPNFILEHEGESKWSLAEFTDAQLKQLAQCWTTNLLNRASEQRVARGPIDLDAQEGRADE